MNFWAAEPNAVSRLAEAARTPAWTARSPVGHCGEPPLRVHGCLSRTLRLCRLVATLQRRADKMCCRVIRHSGFASVLTTPRDGGRNGEGIVQTTTPRHELREHREQGPHMSGRSDRFSLLKRCRGSDPASLSALNAQQRGDERVDIRAGVVEGERRAHRRL